MLENRISHFPNESALLDNNLYQQVIPDGPDNLMRSISDALYFTSVYSDQIQKMCVNYLQHLIEKDSLPAKLNIFKQNKSIFRDYHDNPSWNGFDKINFELVSVIFQARITIYSIQDDILHATYINRNNKKRSIDLLYNKEKQHYDTVYPIKFIEEITESQQIIYDILGKGLNMKINKQNRFVNFQFENWFLERLSKLSRKKQHQRSLSENSSSSGSANKGSGCDQKSADLDTRKDKLSSFLHANNLTFFEDPKPRQSLLYDGPQTTQTGMKNTSSKNFFFNDTVIVDSAAQSQKTLRGAQKDFQFSLSEILGSESQTGLAATSSTSNALNQHPLPIPGLNLPAVSPAIKSPFSIQSQGFFNFNFQAETPNKAQHGERANQNNNNDSLISSPNQQRQYDSNKAANSADQNITSPVYYCKTTPPGLSVRNGNQSSDQFNFRTNTQFQSGGGTAEGNINYSGNNPYRKNLGMIYQDGAPQYSANNPNNGNPEFSGGALSAPRKPIILDESQIQYTGKLKFFDQSKSYGFIVMDSDNSDIFVHWDDLEQAGVTLDMLQCIKSGQPLKFRFCTMMYIGKYNKSKKAVDIEHLID